MVRLALRATALAVLSLAVVWAVPSFAISKEFNQSYPLQPGGSLEFAKRQRKLWTCRAGTATKSKSTR